VKEKDSSDSMKKEARGKASPKGQAGNRNKTAEQEAATEAGADVSEIIDGYKLQLEAQQTRLAETNDKFLRLFSEFDNYRKRVSKERIELTKTAAESIIVALLPVLDDLERASSASKENEKACEEAEGARLIYQKFKTILRQKGVEEIPTVGEAFNTDYHEAISHVPAADENQKGKIVEEIQKGYLLNGKVIRFARVVVAN